MKFYIFKFLSTKNLFNLKYFFYRKNKSFVDTIFNLFVFNNNNNFIIIIFIKLKSRKKHIIDKKTKRVRNKK